MAVYRLDYENMREVFKKHQSTVQAAFDESASYIEKESSDPQMLPYCAKLIGHLNDFMVEFDNLMNRAYIHFDSIESYENSGSADLLFAQDDPNNPHIHEAKVDAERAKILSSSTKIILKEGDNVQELAETFGYEKSDWNKIFVDEQGNPLTADVANNLKPGDVIYFVGLSSGIFSNVDTYTLKAPAKGTNTSSGEIDILSSSTLETSLWGRKYNSYEQFSAPLGSDGSKWVVRTEMGNYSDGGIHWGIDYNNKSGKSGGCPIQSASTGVVIEAGQELSKEWGRGNYIVVLSYVDGKAVVSSYHHMESKTTYNVGDAINQGDIIGNVGSTGHSTGDHLHWECEVLPITEDVQKVVNNITPDENGNISTKDVQALADVGIKRHPTGTRSSSSYTFVNNNGETVPVVTKKNGKETIDPDYVSQNTAPQKAVEERMLSNEK